ncbi:MAG: DNA methyltransferase, partial [Bacteroidota bacterium]
QKDAENKYSVAEYAQRLGLSDTSIRRYMNASEVYRFIEQQVPEGVEVLDEVHKLEEVHRCAQSDWVWLHDFITKHNLSKVQVIDISQAIREIKTDQGEVYGLFDFIKIRQEIAEEIRKGGHALSEVYKELIKTTETSYENLDNELTLFEYNVLNDVIEEEQISLKEWYINNLKSLKNLTKQNVLEAYKDALQLKRSGAEEEAKRTAAYFRDKKNAKEREEQARIEREMRQVQPGEWWQLGRHYLYCGPGSDAVFRQQLPEHIALAYANPPQPKASQWDLDWLASQAEVSAITPPLDQIADFFRLTQMPYQWSMSAQLSMSKGDKGLGSWIYVALFGRKGINPKVVDHWKIDASDLKGNKTQDLLSHLLNAFSQEQEVVLDLYAGLGTMFMLAEDKRRICYGAEANPALCKELIEKWEDLSGDKARRVEKGG